MTTILEILEERKSKAEAMEQEIPDILTMVNVDEVTESMIQRSELKNENSRTIGSLKEKIGEMDNIIRKLRQCNSDLTIQNTKIEAYKWNLINERKLRNV